MIDFRSDTVTQPSAAMRQAISNAEVGDDVYGDDPTVIKLEQRAAQLLGKESALFVSSGTQSNLLALLSHLQRGEEYISGQVAHLYKYEAGGAAVLGGIQPQPIAFEADGTLDLKKVKAAIKADDFHFAMTRLLCLENTVGGVPLPMNYLAEAREFCNNHNLQLHLDGARMVNAAIYHDVSVDQISRHFDTVSLCLSKGLGAPVGSVLAGSTEFIMRAKRWRKMLGGGWRQAGLLAAAGLLALDNIARTKEDHQRATRLAEALDEINEIAVNWDTQKTNMVYLDKVDRVTELAAYLETKGIRITAGIPCRLVIHLDIDNQAIEQLVTNIKAFYKD